MRFELAVGVVADGGTVSSSATGLRVENADAVTLLLATATASTASTRIRRARAATPARSSCGSHGRDARRRGPPSATRTSPIIARCSIAWRWSCRPGPPRRSATDRRIARARRHRSRPRRAAVPVRPLPADRVEPARHAAGQPAGHLERGGAGAVELELHDQHQHPDELLAGRDRQPAELHEPLLDVHRRAGGHRHADRTTMYGAQRLDGAPQHRPLAALGHGRRLGQRRPGVGDVGDGRAVAGAAPLRALPVRRRPRLAARQGLPGHARRRRVLPRLAGRRRQGPPGHRAVDVAREQVHRTAASRARSRPARRWIWR